MLDYIERNPEARSEYIEAKERFERDLSWLRKELPQPEQRSQFYDMLNYQTHSNLRGITIYGYEEAANDSDDGILAVGPMRMRTQRLSPLPLAISLTCYSTRILHECDPDAASDDWVAEFNEWDKKASDQFLAD